MIAQDIISLVHNPTVEDQALLSNAWNFVERAHTGHVRKSGEPYIVHLFETAKNLAELGMSATTIAAGLLHDSVEDVGVTSEEIEKHFGSEIRFLVDGVTKLGKVRYQETTRHHESLRKLFVAMSQDIRVLIIKLCDRLHNMRTLSHVSKEKQLRIAKETLEIYAPIAYRLGIRKVNRELEDLAFAYVYPTEYKKVTELLKQKTATHAETLEKFLKSIKKELAKENITNFKTDYRIKGLYSLYKKLRRYDMDIEKIHDLAAVRILVDTVADCYKILGIVHNTYRPLPGRIKDYIAFPKTNGYQALHTTVFTGDGGVVEVQIKTKEMQQTSEYGIASHLSYKEQTNEGKKHTINPNFLWLSHILPREKGTTGENTRKEIKMNDVPSWIKDLVEYQKEAGEEFLDEAKADFFNERIFVFTPKGDVIDLPIGSSVIDFAYAIHSDIGNHMSGAKINGKFVAIYTELHNGDRVEIETKKNSQPNRKWLEAAKTTMARRRIRSFLEDGKRRSS